MQPDVVRLGTGVRPDTQRGQRRGPAAGTPRRELLVLETLVRRAGRTVVRAALESAVFSLDDDIQSNALDTHVAPAAQAGTGVGGRGDLRHPRRGLSAAGPAVPGCRIMTADGLSDPPAGRRLAGTAAGLAIGAGAGGHTDPGRGAVVRHRQSGRILVAGEHGGDPAGGRGARCVRRAGAARHATPARPARRAARSMGRVAGRPGQGAARWARAAGIRRRWRRAGRRARRGWAGTWAIRRAARRGCARSRPGRGAWPC